jgi:hypothetical protein
MLDWSMPVALAISLWVALPVTVTTYRHHVACPTSSGYGTSAAICAARAFVLRALGIPFDFARSISRAQQTLDRPADRRPFLACEVA